MAGSDFIAPSDTYREDGLVAAGDESAGGRAASAKSLPADQTGWWSTGLRLSDMLARQTSRSRMNSIRSMGIVRGPRRPVVCQGPRLPI